MVGKQTSRDCQGILDNEGARRNAGGKFPLIPVDSLSKAVQITVTKGRGNSMDNLSLPRIYISSPRARMVVLTEEKINEDSKVSRYHHHLIPLLG